MITTTGRQVQGRELTTFTIRSGDMEATFSPSHGMTLLSLRKGSLEVMDQTTRPLFEERCAGLGPLIGPHFHQRPEEAIPVIPHPERFPHLEITKAKGQAEPFSHGVARYAPWEAEVGDRAFSAQLVATEEWNGVPVEDLEGQNFTMWFKGALDGVRLTLHLAITSDTDSLVGFHYYYALPKDGGRILANVQNTYRDVEGYRPIPDSWNLDAQHHLVYSLDRFTDWGFRPYPSLLQGNIILETSTHNLRISYECPNEHNSWQLWHPEKETPFVCIEPLSAKNPRKPTLSVSSLVMHVEPELH